MLGAKYAEPGGGTIESIKESLRDLARAPAPAAAAEPSRNTSATS